MAKTSGWTSASLVVCLVGGCGGGKTESGVDPPGVDESAKTQVLDAGAAVLQDKPPIDALNAYLDGFHFYNGDLSAQMEAHHYCSVLNDDVIQCVIFDGSVREAKIMGVEYIVSAQLFAELPDEEEALWHSHVHEVKSGALVAPGLPDVAEHQLMTKLVNTYGKTWHTWHTDQDLELPLGVPQLMMGFTQDGQADPAMIAQRDERLDIDSSAKRAKRADIPAPRIVPGADSWQQGKVFQIVDPTGQVHDHAQPLDQAKDENATSK